MNKILKFAEKLDNIVVLVCCVLLLGYTGIVLTGVFLRTFFSLAFQWTEELCRYFHIATVVLMCGPLIFKEGHIKVDLLMNYISEKVQAILEIISISLTTCYVGFVLYHAVRWEKQLYDLQSLTNSQAFKLWMPGIAIPVGFFIAFLFCFLLIVKKIKYYTELKRGVKQDKGEGYKGAI